MKTKYIYLTILIFLASCLFTAHALSDDDYQIRSFENFNIFMRSSLLFGLDSDTYNYVALEPLVSYDPLNVFYWDVVTCNGVNTHLQFDDTPYLYFPVGFGAWVKPDRSQIDSYGLVIGKLYNFQLFIIDDGSVNVRYGTSGAVWRTVAAADVIPDGEWSHVYATLEPSGSDTLVKIYIDGDLSISSVQSGQPLQYTGYIDVGARVVDTLTDRFKGVIYKVAIYSELPDVNTIKAMSQNIGAIVGANCYVWTAGEYGGKLYFYALENTTVMIHETMGNVRLNGAVVGEGITATILAENGYTLEWSYTIAPYLPLTLILGLVGTCMMLGGPFYTISKWRDDHDIKGMIAGTVITLIGFALILGWLFI